MFSLAFVVLVLADGSLSLRVSMNVLPLRSARAALKRPLSEPFLFRTCIARGCWNKTHFMTTWPLLTSVRGVMKVCHLALSFFNPSIKSSRMGYWLHGYLIRSTDIRAILTWYSHMIKSFILQTKFKVNNVTKYINLL